MSADSAWKKFEATGAISDYLNYRIQLQSKNNMALNVQNSLINVSPFQGVENENRCEWNNNMGKESHGKQ